MKKFVVLDSNGYVDAVGMADELPTPPPGGQCIETNDALLPEPAWNARFRWATRTWEDTRSVAEVKLAKWAEIKALRDEKELSTFVWDGSTFDIDSSSQRRLLGVSQLAMNTGGRFSVSWTLADGSTRQLGYVDIMNLSAAIGAYVAQLHETARQLKAAIAAAQTVDQVKAIQWP